MLHRIFRSTEVGWLVTLAGVMPAAERAN